MALTQLLPLNLGKETAAVVAMGAVRGPVHALTSYKEGLRSPNYWSGPGKRRVRMVVWHISEGTAASALAWLTNPSSQASSNDVIDREGTVHNIVSGHHTPWTNGRLCRPNRTNVLVNAAVLVGVNPNWWSYTIECAGMSSDGAGGSLTGVQTAALILRTAQACYYNRLTADRVHIVGHYEFDACDRHRCPGFSAAEWSDWVEAVYQVCKSWRGW
jgi:N-acetyl-anhydromuramyl-L-alanine amidase AmpD